MSELSTVEIGRMPEEAVFIGEKKVDHLSIEVIEYDKTGEVKEFGVEDIREILPLNNNIVTWINVVGIHDNEQVKEIGALLDIHSLTVEDILNTSQYPKMEDYDEYLFFITKMLYYKGEEITSEQVSLILGKNFVLTFQENKADIFNHVHRRIRKKKGRIFRSGEDYLAYQLIDSVLENYVLITEKISDKIEDLEDALEEEENGQDFVKEIRQLKRVLNDFRKIIRPTNEFILQINALDTDLIKEPTEPFFKDLLDITVRSNSAIESCKDMLSDNLQIYNLDLSNRFNGILKVLTVFSVIFIPLNFIASSYGMNFVHLPGLEYEYGHWITFSIMILVAISMIFYFKKERWI
jgi:magnesium transporter